jgi:hypothetical protein
MAVDFPNSPSVNDEFTSGARTWIWSGSVWLLKQTINVEVGNLNDVTLTNLANGDALLYNSTSQEWENGAVDVQGAIDTANAYTDSAIEDLTDYVDTYLDPSTGTTVEYIDQQDAATLAAANAYTDAEIAAIPPVDLTGYATEAYVDTAESDAVSTANAYTDSSLSGFDSLPDQTGQSGNYLTTDGSTASWAAIDIPSTTVAENAPAGAEEGDTWFKSSTGQYFVYYDTFWVEVGSGSSTVPLQYFYGLTYGSATGNLIIEYNSIDSSQPALAVSDYDDWFMTSHIQSSPLSFSIVDGHLIMESA